MGPSWSLLGAPVGSLKVISGASWVVSDALKTKQASMIVRRMKRILMIFASRGPLGGTTGELLGRPQPSSRRLGASLTPSWPILSPCIGHLAPYWGHDGPSWGHFAPYWGYLGTYRTLLGAKKQSKSKNISFPRDFEQFPRPCWVYLGSGAILSHLGVSCGHIVAILGPYWAI